MHNEKRLEVAILATMFPSSSRPVYGTFVYECIKQITARCHFEVFSPTPWVPKLAFVPQRWASLLTLPRTEVFHSVTVHRPRFLAFLRRLSFSFWGTSYYSSIKHLIKPGSFDLIHAHQVYPDGYAACLAKKYIKIPVIITIHGELSNPELNSISVKRKVKYALNTADKVIIIGKFQKDLCLQLGLYNEKKLVNIPNGFDTEMFYPNDLIRMRSELGIPQRPKILCYVGHLYPPKGLSYLIKAIKSVVEKNRDILLCIVGDGPLKEELQDLTVSLKLSDNVLFVGQKERHEIPKWMNACDVFVLPSIKEGFPTVIPEALACGKPVVSTNIFGIPDIINSRNVGILVPPGNIKELAEAISKAIDIQWDSDIIIKKAEEYTWQSISMRLIECYEQVQFEFNSKQRTQS